MTLTLKDWNIEEMTGYKPITTFYVDFSIADGFGVNAIMDTFKRAVKDANALGYKYITELVMVLNWKIWEHYESNGTIAKVYNTLWEQLEDYCYNNLKGDELSYFVRTID